MKQNLRKKIQLNLLPLSLLLILIVILFNSFYVLKYRSLIIESNAINNDVIKIREGIKNLEANIFLVDIGLRGYLLKHDESFLDPYNVAQAKYKDELYDLEELLLKYNYQKEKITPAISIVRNYILQVEHMVLLVREGSVDEAFAEFEKDYGKDAWLIYGPFLLDVTSFAESLNSESESKFNTFVRDSLIIQILLLLITVPTLILTLVHILNSKKDRMKLIGELKVSNQQYIFNSGDQGDDLNEQTVIGDLINNLKKASQFIKGLSSGNFNVNWEGVTEDNVALNKENLTGELLAMRNQLQKIKEEDEKRNWFNTGLSKFSDVIRENQNTLKELCDHFISDITKYTNSKQGTLMLLETDPNTEKSYLEIKGMYAYDRKKFISKKIDINSGLAGQCFLEGETIHLTNIPPDYVNITSGLGEARPDALLIVPVKTDEKVVGVLELASFKKYDEHAIHFVENLAENLATAVSLTKNNEQTLTLLRTTQEQTEELKATEEEIRQNMEELQATQEQMNRKNEEVNRLLEASKENEEMMKIQLDEFESLKKDEEELIENLEAYRSMMLDVLNELPFKVFLKDEEGKIFLANTKVAEAHNMEIENLIGKSDHDFVDKETADLWRHDELEIIKKGEDTYVFEEDMGHGKRIMETIKKRFYIRPIKQIGLLGIQKDISNESNATNRLKEFNKRKQEV